MHWKITWIVALLASSVAPAAALGLEGPTQGGQQAALVLGDSLSTAYGMMQDQGWVALTAARISERGRPGSR